MPLIFEIADVALVLGENRPVSQWQSLQFILMSVPETTQRLRRHVRIVHYCGVVKCALYEEARLNLIIYVYIQQDQV